MMSGVISVSAGRFIPEPSWNLALVCYIYFIVANLEAVDMPAYLGSCAYASASLPNFSWVSFVDGCPCYYLVIHMTLIVNMVLLSRCYQAWSVVELIWLSSHVHIRVVSRAVEFHCIGCCNLFQSFFDIPTYACFFQRTSFMTCFHSFYIIRVLKYFASILVIIFCAYFHFYYEMNRTKYDVRDVMNKPALSISTLISSCLLAAPHSCAL